MKRTEKIDNRQSKIELLEGIKTGKIHLKSLSFETGNYIHAGFGYYVKMEGTKVFSYLEFLEIANQSCFEMLNPSYTTDCPEYPFCITITRK
jgi:hypothetical protein